jgi:hypothetical protein
LVDLIRKPVASNDVEDNHIKLSPYLPYVLLAVYDKGINLENVTYDINSARVSQPIKHSSFTKPCVLLIASLELSGQGVSGMIENVASCASQTADIQ